MLNRIKLRLDLEDYSQDALLLELLRGAQDAICLYTEEDELPSMLETTAVLLTVDCYNRLGTEGMKSENKGSLSQAFYDDMLDPYKAVLDKYVAQKKAKKRVIFA